MPTPILMPALSPTMTEGNLARWLKKEGDVVKSGQVIAEIETDKATMEVEAVDEGKILKIIVPAGAQGIKVNAPIAILAEEGENITAEAALASLNVANDKTANIAGHTGALQPVTDQKVQTSSGQTGTAQTVTAQAGAAHKSAAQMAVQPSPHVAGGRVFASPLAKRVAAQNGLDLQAVKGTGPNGRIIQADVRAALANKGAAQSMAGSAKGAATTQGVDARDYASKLGMAFEAQPNSGVRKVIARRLTEAKQTIPHFYLTIDCELDALLALRKNINDATGAKISVNDFVIRATALALKKVPAANASWTDEAILLYQQADISVAVATPNGLITPIIKAADTKSLSVISTEMKDLAARARDGKLKPEEFQGGGFSVSNLGMFGIKSFSAIINPPQSCILAVGAGEQRAVVKNGQLAVATVMTVTLSIDHRSVDGAVGAEFLAAFKPLIEQPYALLS